MTARLFDEPTIDLAGMQRAKRQRLRAEMDRRGVDALWLMGPGHLRYAVGSGLLPTDAGRGTCQRVCAVFDRSAEYPHLFTPYPDAAPPELPDDHVHAPLDVESFEGLDNALRNIHDVLGRKPTGPVAIDEYSPALFFRLSELFDAPPVDAAALIGRVKLHKTAEEVECIRRAQAINERAMLDVQAQLRPGLRQSELTAVFFSRIFELGATANGIDPIWQVMPERLADGPWTSHGHVGFPTTTTDRVLRAGDVLWVDTGIEYHGYQSDFGRTFLVGAEPSARQLDLGRRWLDVVEAVLEMLAPGVTGRDLTRRALEVSSGVKPWLEHFYLIHGVGTEPAEPPFIGTDLGDAYDDKLVLAPGMVCVLEPAIWEDGVGGYRSEEIVAVTESGCEKLSNYSYAPFESSMGNGLEHA